MSWLDIYRGWQDAEEFRKKVAKLKHENYKPKTMSSKDSNELIYFIDKLILANYSGADGTLKEWRNFLAEQSQPKQKRDWEILSFNHDFYGLMFRQDDGYYHVSNIGKGWCISESEALITKPMSIFSVRRSDGEVFKVWDAFLHTLDGLQYQLKSFTIHGGEMFVRSLRDDVIDLKSIAPIPVKQVLFTTEDGVDIFEGDTCQAIILKEWDIIEWHGVPESVRLKLRNGDVLRKEDFKFFHSKEKAEEYILMNRPVLSVNEAIKNGAWSSGQGENEKRWFLVSDLKQLAKQKIDSK